MKDIFLILVAILGLSTSAFAVEIPAETPAETPKVTALHFEQQQGLLFLPQVFSPKYFLALEIFLYPQFVWPDLNLAWHL